MKIHFTLLLFLVFLMNSSCSFQQSKEDEQKDSLVSREEMILILADMQITEAHLESIKKAGKKVKDSSLVYYEQVFKKNQVTQEEFESSLLYYKQDLEDLKKMYTQVIIRLNELKAKNEEMLLFMKADSLRKDSIQEAEHLLDSIRNAKISLDSLNQANDTIFVD
ncbi:MAG: DUF4296 domain-containing protein [Bacteroidales bacterium]|nr:DUF4296 domain-containing protein [Bacteroidales bacterium]